MIPIVSLAAYRRFQGRGCKAPQGRAAAKGGTGAPGDAKNDDDNNHLKCVYIYIILLY